MGLQASWIGRHAKEALEARWPASVIGVTSGGVFVRAGNRRVIFMTYSPFRSPITINLTPQDIDLQQFEIGQPVTLSPALISFQQPAFTVRAAGAGFWDPTVPVSSHVGDWPQIAARMRRIALTAGGAKGEQGFAPALAALVGASPFRSDGDLSLPIVEAMIVAFGFCRSGDYLSAVKAAFRWVGYGRGLTPAGDDCLAGMLLVLNRWSAIIPAVDLPSINESALRYSEGRTTMLSTSIIQAAVAAQADERILTVLDGVITGDFNEDLSVTHLVKMGHSSGVDTLAGITLILASRFPIISDLA